ncbi:Trk system potassium uptake protein TrkA [Euzebya pacifica]|uniref:Trk system potassium uptake protein TrkA n=1 Tax=Euzebya pacifica TaxID=1608957 RepID=A0A346XU03_9ACTN|nr:NAD-binding protein [Euzebya pacifica]AXV05700.1 Trk system potassium uptake protein TrkA [Euzebya pacifica]
MKVVIAGAGGIGRYLAAELRDRGHDLTIVEKRDEAVARVGDGIRIVHGDACAPAVLEAAEVRSADVVVAVTGDDEDNLVVSLLSKEEFGVPRVLARVNYPANEWLFDASWGVDLAVSPPHLLTALVEEEVLTGDLISLLKLGRGEIELLEVRLDEKSAATGQRVDGLPLPPDSAIVAIVRGNRVLPARGTTALTEGDEVLALVPVMRVEEMREALIGGR